MLIPNHPSVLHQMLNNPVLHDSRKPATPGEVYYEKRPELYSHGLFRGYDILLNRAGHSFSPGRSDAWWGTYVKGSLIVITVPGDHNNLFYSLYCKILAEKIEERLMMTDGYQ